MHLVFCPQIRCSSSYAFAAIGALEGASALSGEALVSLSAQNIVDCSGILNINKVTTQMSSILLSVPYGNHGCSCGNMNSAYLYIIDNEGIDTRYSYPYRSRVSRDTWCWFACCTMQCSNSPCVKQCCIFLSTANVLSVQL